MRAVRPSSDTDVNYDDDDDESVEYPNKNETKRNQSLPFLTVVVHLHVPLRTLLTAGERGEGADSRERQEATDHDQETKKSTLVEERRGN